LIVIEDIDFSGSFCHPSCAAYEKYIKLYQEVVYRRGGDPNIGPKLPGMLRQAGAEGIKSMWFSQHTWKVKANLSPQ
jgi:hypothetical protein